ncbi:MAG: argininosuccinate lyase [Bacteroidetes bacterium]|nr:argininosuccinate lyase [Bacteroidota bacterium]MDA1120042.1 argininosuccinate lyase [Bacteroidota bacterium]
MKIWQKSGTINEQIEAFTIGKDAHLDLMLAPYDIEGTIAHITMLQKVGLLTESELNQLLPELKNLHQAAINGELKIDDGVEDIHSQIEFLLTQKLGEVGKKIHSGRSRNDQVILDIKLFTRAKIKEVVAQVKSLFDQLIELSEQHKNALIPGYTHMQIAMPSSFGLWFGAYAESLIDDLTQLQAAYKITNRNPLGSAAGYGSSFPLDRELTTRLLGFDTMNNNVVYAQMTRGKTEKVVSQALASIATTMARLSMDVCMYMNQNFGFLSFPDHLTTGSSIMPHKKNPDVFELVRAKCNKIKALPNEIDHILGNLPSGYHRDLQLIKENYLPIFDELNECLAITQVMFDEVKIKEDILENPIYNYLFSVEVVNEKVLEGRSFREAYKEVGKMIEEGTFQPRKELNHTSKGTLGNLNNGYLVEMMEKVMQSFK